MGGRVATPLIDRISEKFQVVGECWEWTAKTNGSYGQIRQDGLYVYAHRAVYELLVGPIPKGREIHHLCENKLCINPDHLKVVTHQENIQYNPRPKVQFCPQGHDTFTHGRRSNRTCIMCHNRR